MVRSRKPRRSAVSGRGEQARTSFRDKTSGSCQVNLGLSNKVTGLAAMRRSGPENQTAQAG